MQVSVSSRNLIGIGELEFLSFVSGALFRTLKVVRHACEGLYVPIRPPVRGFQDDGVTFTMDAYGFCIEAKLLGKPDGLTPPCPKDLCLLYIAHESPPRYI